MCIILPGMKKRPDPSPEVLAARYVNLEKQYKKILEFHDTCRIVMEQQGTEEALRNEYPSLMQVWEEYQVMLRLIQAGQLSR